MTKLIVKSNQIKTNTKHLELSVQAFSAKINTVQRKTEFQVVRVPLLWQKRLRNQRFPTHMLIISEKSTPHQTLYLSLSCLCKQSPTIKVIDRGFKHLAEMTLSRKMSCFCQLQNSQHFLILNRLMNKAL